jgi:threonine/homoserine/homoserine lactone efflux protein
MFGIQGFLGIHDFALFLGVGILLNLTPGPDTALVVSHSLRQGAHGGAHGGARGGVLAALGVGTGCFVHIAAATLGLSALLVASATAFAVLKWAGAAYLAFIGLSMMFGAPAPTPDAAPTRAGAASGRSAFLQGFLTNALNPKVALFFLAFLPQFVSATAPGKALGFALLGVIFDTTGTIWLVILAVAAARSARHFAGSAAWRRWSQRLIGVVFVALAGKLAAARAP